MNDQELNEVIRVYLGSDENGSVIPVGELDRMKSAYGDKAGHMADLARGVIGSICDVPPHVLGTDNLAALARLAESRAADSHPELAPDVCRAIGNHYAYQWK